MNRTTERALIGVGILTAAVIGATIYEPTGPSRTEPVPQPWRNYSIDKVDIYEWKDQWGRVCTFTKLYGGREQALDCDWPSSQLE